MEIPSGHSDLGAELKYFIIVVHTTGLPSFSSAASISTPVGLPELLPNCSGDLVSRPKEVTDCTCAEELPSPLLQMVLLLHVDYDFLGTLCPTRMAMDLLFTRGGEKGKGFIFTLKQVMLSMSLDK